MAKRDVDVSEDELYPRRGFPPPDADAARLGGGLAEPETDAIRPGRWVVGGLIGGAVFGIALLGLAGFLIAHEAPSGWTYPLACCSGEDCRAIGERDVEATPVGWFVPASRETIDYHDPVVKPSPDGLFHRCSVGGKPEGRTICLFVPARV